MPARTDGSITATIYRSSLAIPVNVMERMKKAGVCVELCPISNEVLGLTPRVGGHAMYSMLANNVHCTVSSDNGTLFK